MPAISIDTFFACSLMVLLVLSAMATTSKVLYPYLNNEVDANLAERYREISRYILLNAGKPSNWGQNNQTIPENFGLAKVDSDSEYALDVDKVSRLNSENLYALTYAQMFTALGTPDVSFRIEVKPIFDVAINLTATYALVDETVYEFEISTQRHGVAVQTELKTYVVAEDYLESNPTLTSDGTTFANVTIPNSVAGQALLVVFARSAFDNRIVSFNAYGFAHNSAEPNSNGSFLGLTPLNNTLTASLQDAAINLSNAYALTFTYSTHLTQTASSNQSATYPIPRFLDSSPTLLVVTGQNATDFFAEYTAYPQIPVQAGADFSNASTLSDVFAYTYTVTIDSALYECTVWLGGPRY